MNRPIKSSGCSLKASKVDPSAGNKKNMTQNRFNKTLSITETDGKTQEKTCYGLKKTQVSDSSELSDGLDQNTFMCYNGPGKVQTYI